MFFFFLFSHIKTSHHTLKKQEKNICFKYELEGRDYQFFSNPTCELYIPSRKSFASSPKHKAKVVVKVKALVKVILLKDKVHRNLSQSYIQQQNLHDSKEIKFQKKAKA